MAGPTRLWQLLVDQRHQRRGIATRVIGEIARRLVADGEEWLDASFVDEPGGPEVFYRRLGFWRTGTVEPDGERSVPGHGRRRRRRFAGHGHLTRPAPTVRRRD
jgi:hypothetical protein